MIDGTRKKEAQQNFANYLQEGLIKKEKNETASVLSRNYFPTIAL